MRVHFVQPAIPLYRVPFFEELGTVPDFVVSVAYCLHSGIPNALPTEVETSGFKQLEFHLGSRIFRWIGAQFVSRSNSDVVVLEWNVNNLSLIPAIAWARLRGVGVLLWGHGYSTHESWLRKHIRDFVGRMANGVVVYDESTMRSLRSNSLRGSNVHVAQNAIDVAPILDARQSWDDVPGRLDSFQTAMGLKGVPTILSVSRLVPERHLDVLIRAMPRILDTVPAAKTVIVGDGPEREVLASLVHELGLGESVDFVGAEYDEERLAGWFMSASVFCSPAHLGLSVFHASAYGVPVVTGDRIDEHPPEVRSLRHGHSGLLFSHDDEEDLATVVVSLLADADARSRLGEAALHEVCTRYTIEAMVDGMALAIESVTPEMRG